MKLTTGSQHQRLDARTAKITRFILRNGAYTRPTFEHKDTCNKHHLVVRRYLYNLEYI